MTTFAEMDLDRRALEALGRMDVVEPTPIQAAAVPQLMAGRDVVGQARTGSGKTLAFSLPLLSLCDPERSVPQALILVPTRELASQVARVVDALAATRKLRAAQIYGGRDMSAQLDLLNTGPQIIIGTPGRVLDHLYRGSLSLRHLRYLVLDEADQMLDAGFGPDVERILDTTTAKAQMALFSATVPEWVHDVISHRLHDPAFIKVDEQQRGPNESVDHTVIEVTHHNKLEALCSLLNERGSGNVVVFCRTKIGVEKLERQLSGLGYAVAALQGNQNQMQRERVLRGFRRGNPPILVATNVAARGLDILSIEQVINYDVPENAELLTHRLGRTGRMGRHGSAVTLLTPSEGNKWKAIEHQIGVRVQRERYGAPRREVAATTEPTEASAGVPASTGNGRAPHTADGESRKARSPGRRPRNRAPRQRYDVTCAACGQQTTVSFAPSADRPVYCAACYRERKDTSAA